MKHFEIKECVACPFSRTSNFDENNYYVGDDMFHIICEHENQTNREGFTAKIKNQFNNIYFNCPL